MKRRSLMVLLALAMVFSLSQIYGADISQIQQARQWAADKGIPQDFLEVANDPLILQIYDENSALEHVELTADCLDPSENDNDPTLWTVAAKSLSGGYIDKVNIYIHFDWQSYSNMLYFTDGISAAWESGMWNFGAPFSCKVYGHAQDARYIDSSNYGRLSQGSVGVTFDIKAAYGVPYGSVSFCLTPKSPLVDSDSIKNPVTSQYAHGVPGMPLPFSFAAAGLFFQIFMILLALMTMMRKGGKKIMNTQILKCIAVMVFCLQMSILPVPMASIIAPVISFLAMVIAVRTNPDNPRSKEEDI